LKKELVENKVAGECVLINISYIMKESLCCKNIWLLIKDQASSMKWSYFMCQKGKLIEKIMVFVKVFKAKDTNTVKDICLDNNRENLGLKHFLEKEGIETMV
jgi:hypothetical protein